MSVCVTNQFTSNHCLDCSVYVWYHMLIFVEELSRLTLVKKPPHHRFNTWATPGRLILRVGLWHPIVEVCRRHMEILLPFQCNNGINISENRNSSQGYTVNLCYKGPGYKGFRI
jgi:hypothetical protein